MREQAISARAAAPRGKFSQFHWDYLQSRGIANAMQAIGARTETSRQGDVIALPYGGDMLKVYDPARRDDPWRQWKPKEQRLPLWRLADIDFTQTWVLTEGEWDAATAFEAGYRNVTSLPDGACQPNEETPAKSGKLACVREAWPRISSGKGHCILALDNDGPGRTTQNVLIDILGRWRCRAVEYPEHPKAKGDNGRCKDLNEVYQLFGMRAVKDCLDGAKLLRLEGVFKPDEIARGEPRQFYDVGLPGFDMLWRPYRGSLSVMTGYPGHGKSQVMYHTLAKLAEQGLTCAVFWGEADFWEDVHPWYHAYLYGKNRDDETYSKTTDWLQENFTIISHDVEPLSKLPTMEWYMESVMEAKGRYNVDVSAIDPFNKLMHIRKPGESQTEYIGRVLAEYYNLLTTYRMIGLINAHPVKPQKGDLRPPTAYDIDGSAHWYNSPEFVATVFRPFPDQCGLSISMEKTGRGRGSGIKGKRLLVFDSDINQYKTPAELNWPAHMIQEVAQACE